MNGKVLRALDVIVAIGTNSWKNTFIKYNMTTIIDMISRRIRTPIGFIMWGTT